MKSKKTQRQDEIEWKKSIDKLKNGTLEMERKKKKEIKSYIKINGYQASAKKKIKKKKHEVNCLCKRSAMNKHFPFFPKDETSQFIIIIIIVIA